MSAVGIALALAAALCFAVASVLQQRAAADVPDEDALGVGLVSRLATRPLWLLGFACDSAGYVLQAVALIWGSIVVVQPILVTTLLFALPLGARFAARRLRRADWAWAAVLVAALVVFLLVGFPTAGIDTAPFRRWVLPLALVGGAVSVCVVVAARRRGPIRALLLAISSGLLYGLTGALTKSVMDAFDDGILEALEPLVTNWETYVLAIAITGGLFLQQSAYQAGNLQQSLPAITILEPVLAIALGIMILEERFRSSGLLEWAVLIAAAAAMATATWQLSRSSAEHEARLVETIPGYTPG